MEKPSMELVGGAEPDSPGGAIVSTADQVRGGVLPVRFGVAEVFEYLEPRLAVRLTEAAG